MKFYLSSYRLGNEAKKLVSLLPKNKKAAVIANAVDDVLPSIRIEKVKRELEDLKKIGIEAEEIDLRNYFGKKELLRKKLSEYGMVWVRGGNTYILRRAYDYSGFDSLLKEKLTDKKFVYAGYSAGICILSLSLKGLDIVDDPNIVPKKYKKEIIWDGLGFINYNISPHYRSNHPESALVEKEVQYCINNKILFKALRDGEVIILE